LALALWWYLFRYYPWWCSYLGIKKGENMEIEIGWKLLVGMVLCVGMICAYFGRKEK
jgi:hypothetical protein